MKDFPLLIVLALWFVPACVFSQEEAESGRDGEVKSIQLYRDGFVISNPWIRLNTNEQLTLSFDILGDEEEILYYTFEHCNAAREPDELQKYEYLKGFEENEIEDIKASFQMKQSYVHYTVKFPNDNVRLTKSGNYKVIVYRDTPDEPLFERYFWIVEQRLGMDAAVGFCTAAGTRNRKQEIDFTLNTKNITIIDPYENLEIAIMQNVDWDNRLQNISPQSIGTEEINYHFDGLLCVDGLNEFRQFNTKSLYTQTENVKRIFVRRDSVHVELFTDKSRNGLAYVQRDDMNGKAFIGSQDLADPDIESEYTWVWFSLESRFPVQDAAVYVFAGLTDWKISPEGKMEYDFKTRQYKTKMYLKQGIYDYMYLVAGKDGSYDYTYFEGNHSETRNQYTIFVYYREPNTFYDRLIGIKSVESFEH